MEPIDFMSHRAFDVLYMNHIIARWLAAARRLSQGRR